MGTLLTTSPSFNLYKIVVFPAPSRPARNILAYLLKPLKLLNKLIIFYDILPIFFIKFKIFNLIILVFILKSYNSINFINILTRNINNK